MNFRTFLEIFGSFNYTFPEDKEKQLFDFYMIVGLLGRPSHYLLSKSAELGKKLEYPPTKEIENEEDKVDYLLQEAANILVPGLKENFLEATYFAMTAEFRHIFDQNNPTSILNMIKKMGKDYDKFLINYAKQFAGRKEPNIGQFYRTPETTLNEPGDSTRIFSYFASLKSGASKEEFVDLMKILFFRAHWQADYGGNAWTQIADAWLKLNNAKKLNDQIVYIDHIYDLQHNTDTVFNKLESYLKQGSYTWLKNALNLKAKIKDFHEIIDKISPSLKPLALRAIKLKFGKTYEEFIKEEKPDVKPTINIEIIKTIFRNVDGISDFQRLARTLISGVKEENLSEILKELNLEYDATRGFYKALSKEIDKENAINQSLEKLIMPTFDKIKESTKQQATETIKELQTKFPNIPFSHAVSVYTLDNIIVLMKNNQFIHAIKLIREKTNYSLIASKNLGLGIAIWVKSFRSL